MNWLARTIANHLPGRVVYWCLMRAYYNALERRIARYGPSADASLADVFDEWLARGTKAE